MAPINEEHPSTLEQHPHIVRYVPSDEGRHEAYSKYCPSTWHYLLVAIRCATVSLAYFSRLTDAVVCLIPIEQYCELFRLLLMLTKPFSEPPFSTCHCLNRHVQEPHHQGLVLLDNLRYYAVCLSFSLVRIANL